MYRNRGLSGYCLSIKDCELYFMIYPAVVIRWKDPHAAHDIVHSHRFKYANDSFHMFNLDPEEI